MHSLSLIYSICILWNNCVSNVQSCINLVPAITVSSLQQGAGTCQKAKVCEQESSLAVKCRRQGRKHIKLLLPLLLVLMSFLLQFYFFCPFPVQPCISLHQTTKFYRVISALLVSVLEGTIWWVTMTCSSIKYFFPFSIRNCQKSSYILHSSFSARQLIISFVPGLF